jgi:hypothetical protein
MHMVLAKRLKTGWLSALLLAIAVQATPSHAGVADPAAALKSLYAGLKATPSSNTSTIATLYSWADRNLRRKLMANGVCTIPFRSRDITCALRFDPATAGTETALPDPAFTAVAANPNERQITVGFTDEDVKLEVIYRFARNGGTWELTDIEGKPPHTKPWKLSETVGGN